MGAGTREEQFRPDIEGLRGIAVALVVLFHAGLLSNAGLQIGGGFIGVDLFFVISGFLITGLLIRERERSGKTSFARFYARRVRRILPAAVVTLIVTIPIAYALLTLIDRREAMVDASAAAVSIANIRFALTVDYFHPASSNYSPFLHFWSLGVEEQFYFLWPALLALVAWRRPRLGAGIALSLLVVASFVASVQMTFENPSWAFYMLPTRAWQLGAGGLLAVLTGTLPRLPRAIDLVRSGVLAAAGWVALGALGLAAILIDSQTPYPGTAALWPTLAGVVLIASGAERLGPGIFLRIAPVRFLGRISYSLYLWHWPILILGGLALNGPLDQTLNPGQAFGLVLLSIPVATLSWALVEEPFRRGRIPLPRPGRVVAMGATTMAIVAIVGVGFNWNAQKALAGIGSDPIAQVESPAPDPTQRSTEPPATEQPGTPAPHATPTPSPTLGAALSPIPAGNGSGVYSLNAQTRPSLANLENDKEKAWLDNCVAWENVTVPHPNCVYGNKTGTYTVALVGDSHASALFPAVNEVAKAHGWKLIPYLKVSCTFVDFAIENFELKRTYPECATWNDNVIAALRANPVDLVLVSNSRWMFPVDAKNESVAAEGNGVAREIQKIPARTKVVIIEDIPLATFDVPKCLAANVGDFRKCDYPRWQGYASAMGEREKIEVEVTGAGLVDLTEDVCPGTGACPVVIRNIIVWRDMHHLTATFSATLGPSLDRKLVSILNAGR